MTDDAFSVFVAARGCVTLAERPLDLALYTRSDPTLAVSGALVFRMTEGPVVDSSSMHSRSANRQTLAKLTPSLRATREA